MILISQPFNRQGNFPLDSDYVVDTIQDRDNIAAAIRFEGLPIFVKNTTGDENDPNPMLYHLAGGVENSNWVSGIGAIPDAPADHNVYGRKDSEWVVLEGAEPVPQDTDDLAEGSINLYYTDVRVSGNTAVVANTAARHTHGNLAILNSTEESFTTALKNKLDGIQTGAEVNVNSDWNAASGDAMILNKPTVPSVINDLSDVNTIGAVNSSVLQFNGMEWVPAAISIGGGDMTKIVYDPDGVNANSFDYNNFINTPDVPQTTDNLTEGSVNLYYTNTRVSANTDVVANTTARHTHSNKSTLDLIVNVGSGSIITSIERNKLNGIEDNATADQLAAEVPIADTADYFDSADVEGALAELGETNDINGYDLLSLNTLPDLSFNTSTRTFTTSVKSGQSDYTFWCNGHKIIKTTSESVILPNVTGTYYIYFDNDGVLQYVLEGNIALEQFYQNAITGLVYWNAETGAGIAGDERHGKTMDARTHHYNHSTYGARYEADGGMDITGLTNGGTTFSTITSGSFWDEDIRHSVSLTSTAPFIYRYGAAGAWRSTAAGNEVSYNAGGNYDVWNEWDGSTWKLTEGASDSDFWIIFTIATPDLSGSYIKKILGQNSYPSRSAARAALEDEINKITTDGLPSPEFVFLHAWIVKRDGTLVADADGNTHIDLRALKGGVGSTSAAASKAADVVVDTTNFNNNLSETDNEVQVALETIDGLFPKQAKPTVPSNLSPSPTREEVQAILDYAKSIDTKLQTIGLFI